MHLVLCSTISSQEKKNSISNKKGKQLTAQE